MRRQDQHCYNILIKALQENDMTYKEMMEISGFSYFCLVRLTKRLKEEKIVHVCGYYKDAMGRDTIQIYRYGKGRDAKRSKLTGTEKQRSYLRRKNLKSIPTSLIAGVNL
jgi:hypothetical protein